MAEAGQLSLSVVSAMIDPERTSAYWPSWRIQARGDYEGVVVLNGAPSAARPEGFDVVIRSEEVLGPVPAFAKGIEEARGSVIAALHDDVEILQRGWDESITTFFEQHPKCGLLGFSGCDGLGDPQIYRKPYDPMQLARVGFFSNMREAEKHGRRELMAVRSACADGFSQVGRASFMKSAFHHFTDLKIVHHAFDSWLGALALRQGWEVWFLPIPCHHAGGRSAVSAAEYHTWASARGGDANFWQQSHRAMYEDCRHELPIRVR